MKKIKLLLSLVLSMMAWNGVMAQNTSDADYQAALAAITDGGTYRIFTEVSGVKYYVTTAGKLAPSIADGGKFTITKTSGGYFGTGFRIDGGNRFTNPPLSGSVANLKPGNFSISTGDRADWERQILYLNGDGKYAIRSCNCPDGTSSWNDAARTHWTYYMVEDVVTPCYSYDRDYIWQLEAPGTSFDATFNLYYEGTKVESKTVSVEAGFPTISSVSYDNNSLFTYSCDKAIVEEGVTEYDVTATWKGYFEFSQDFENAKWYYANIRGSKWLRADEDNKDGSGRYTTNSINEKTDVYKWAFIGNPFKFAIVNMGAGESKYLYNTDGGAVTPVMTAGVDPAADTNAQWIATANGTGFTVRNLSGETFYINDNGGNGNLGFWNSAGGAFDGGSRWEVEEVPASTVNVTYNVIINGQVVRTATDIQGIGAEPTIPETLKHSLITSFKFNVDKLTAQTTTIEATPVLPFEVSADYATAHWYDMAMRETYYVTTDAPNADGSYNSVNANAMGLVKDSYQWAFVGNPYDGFKVLNKAAGDGFSFGYTDAAKTNQGIPTVMADSEGTHVWNLGKSTSGIKNSFFLNVPGTDLYINQFGGAGGSLKFWNSANNVGDPGSAFTVFDVPDNFAEYTANIEALMTSNTTGYFSLNAATRALWKDEYKTNCPYATYAALQEAIDNDANWSWPETGYYRMKSVEYPGYVVSYSEFEGNSTMAAVQNPAEVASIVKLTALGNHKYTVNVGGLYASAPAQSEKIGLSKTSTEFTAEIHKIGQVSFSTGEQFGAIHCANSQAYYCVGWTADAGASQWTIEDATFTGIDVNITDAGFATLNALWPVAIPDGVKAYTGKIQGNFLSLTEVTGTIPAATPVVLEGAAGTYTFEVADDVKAIENDLKGTYIAAKPEGALTLQVIDEALGFYTFNGESIPANKAYLLLPGESSVKVVFNDATAIKGIQFAGENNVIFNLAGQRINKAQKGIYIINGKKAVVK